MNTHAIPGLMRAFLRGHGQWCVSVHDADLEEKCGVEDVPDAASSAVKVIFQTADFITARAGAAVLRLRALSSREWIRLAA